MKRLILQTLTPRNPFVAAGLMRHAGAHRRSAGGMRQRARQSVRQAVAEARREREGP